MQQPSMTDHNTSLSWKIDPSELVQGSIFQLKTHYKGSNPTSRVMKLLNPLDYMCTSIMDLEAYLRFLDVLCNGVKIFLRSHLKFFWYANMFRQISRGTLLIGNTVCIYIYSVDHQWCLGWSIPFCHFSWSIPF